MESQNVKLYEIKKTISEQEFLRAVVIRMGISEETPSNVLDGEFGQVTCENHHFVSMGGSAKVRCSASIGHDYQVEKKEYDHINKRYKTIQKTETQWSPYQTTHFAENAVGFAENSENPRPETAATFRKLVTSIPRDELITIDTTSGDVLMEKGFREVKDTAINASMEDMKADAVLQAKKALPGDRYKDFSASADVDVRYGANYVVPCHKVSYSFFGESHCVLAYANGKCMLRGSIPIQSEQAKPNKTASIVKGISLGLSLLLLILAVCSLQSLVLPWIVVALATIAFIAYKWLDIHHRKGLNHKKVKAKYSAVIRILNEKGLRPLSEQEQKEFLGTYKKGHKRAMTFGDAFVLVSYIVSLGLFLLNHDPDALVSILLTLALIGIPALIIYGLVLPYIKKQ